MDFKKLADEESLKTAIGNLEKHNIEVVVTENKNEALEKLKSLIPAGSQVMTGSSTTLDQIGFTQLLKSGNHPWKNLKEEIIKETDLSKQAALRRASVTSDYFMGSVHAITMDGQVLIASATGSQLPAYAFSSPHVIWVCGTQKIVPDYNLGIKRIEEYLFPLEDQRMKSVGGKGSSINKILTIKQEAFKGRIKLILVKEVLGF